MPAMTRRSLLGYTALAAVGSLGHPFAVGAQEALADLPGTPGSAEVGFTVEYYYKVQWGAYAEFRRLYIKNHLPILRRYQQRGYILAMSAATPITHVGEVNRWDLRFAITWKDASHAFGALPDEAAITQELFPDQETFRREEQRRFELIVEHLDLPVTHEDVTAW